MIDSSANTNRYFMEIPTEQSLQKAIVELVVKAHPKLIKKPEFSHNIAKILIKVITQQSLLLMFWLSRKRLHKLPITSKVKKINVTK